MLKEILKGGSLILTSVVISKIFSILYIPVLARYLGPSSLGLYNLALVMLPWFITFTSLSLSTIVAQLVAEHSKDEKKLSQIITTCLLFSIVLGVIGGAIHFFSAKMVATRFFNSEQLVQYLRLASLVIVAAIFYNTLIGIVRGLKNFKLYLSMEVVRSFSLVVIGLLFLVILRYKIKGAIVALVIASVIPTVNCLFCYKDYLRTRIQWSIVATTLKSSLWITPLGFFISVLLTVDKFFLGAYTDPSTVGLYAVVVSLVTTASLIPGSFKGSILPFISERFTKKGEISLTLQKVTVYILILMGLVVIGLVAFRKEIILVLFGREFLPSAAVLPILALTLLPYTIYTLIHSVVIDRRLVAKTTLVVLPVVLVALLIDAVLIKNFSAIGAGFGLFVSHTLIASVYLYMLKERFKFNIWHLLLLLKVIIITSGIAIFLPSSILYKIPLFAVLLLLYLSLLFIFRYITREEINWLMLRVRKFTTRKKS